MSTHSSAVLATRTSRFLARLVDGLIGAVPFVILGSIGFGYMAHFLIMMDTPNHADMAAQTSFLAAMISAPFFLVAGLLIVAYMVVQAYLLTTRGQTIGKILLKIRIANVSTGESKGFLQNVLLREILTYVLSSIPFYGLVDVLFIFREDKRCIHDLIASTVVVKA